MVRWFGRKPKTSNVDAVILIGTRRRGFVNAVGESNYQGELRSIVKANGGENRKDGVRVEVHVALVPEPENKHDSNAVSIQLDGKRLGYLSRDDAVAYQPVLLHLAQQKKYGACRAFIFGGSEDKPSYGIFLDLASPDDVLDDLENET